MYTYAIKAGDKKVRTRGNCLYWLQKRVGKLAKDLHLRACKHIRNMMIDNVKNKSDLLKTDNINIKLQNFVEYYAKLYEQAPIKKCKMLRVLVDTPKGKSPDTDELPYEYYKRYPNKAAQILADINNRAADSDKQPISWAQIIISVIPKELDSYFTHKFQPR
jgi:hypothetical protein